MSWNTPGGQHRRLWWRREKAVVGWYEVVDVVLSEGKNCCRWGFKTVLRSKLSEMGRYWYWSMVLVAEIAKVKEFCWLRSGGEGGGSAMPPGQNLPTPTHLNFSISWYCAQFHHRSHEPCWHDDPASNLDCWLQHAVGVEVKGDHRVKLGEEFQVRLQRFPFHLRTLLCVSAQQDANLSTHVVLYTE